VTVVGTSNTSDGVLGSSHSGDEELYLDAADYGYLLSTQAIFSNPESLAVK